MNPNRVSDLENADDNAADREEDDERQRRHDPVRKLNSLGLVQVASKRDTRPAASERTAAAAGGERRVVSRLRCGPSCVCCSGASGSDDERVGRCATSRSSLLECNVAVRIVLVNLSADIVCIETRPALVRINPVRGLTAKVHGPALPRVAVGAFDIGSHDAIFDPSALEQRDLSCGVMLRLDLADAQTR